MGQVTIWEEDAALVAVRKLPGWSRFHRLCGDSGVFFEVERVSPRRAAPLYRCIAVRFEKARSDFYRTIEIASADAGEPLAAVLAAFDRSRNAGDLVAAQLDADLPALLGAKPGLDDTMAALLGGTPPDPMKELIG